MMEDKVDLALNVLKQAAIRESPDFSSNIMDIIRLDEESVDIRQMPIRGWLIAGAVILASLVLTPFGKDISWLSAFFSSAFMLPLAITLGGVLSIFCGLFIASHLEEFRERFHLKNPNSF